MNTTDTEALDHLDHKQLARAFDEACDRAKAVGLLLCQHRPELARYMVKRLPELIQQATTKAPA